MHDPNVVAFDIKRPWPKRDKMHDAKPGQPRWVARHHHDCTKYGCEAEHAGKRFFPWYRPGSYSSFWVIAGRGWYWPSMITIWHREPGGHDSGEICKHYRRVRKPAYGSTYETKILHGWKWHVWHWHIQVHPFQEWRRRLLTRCSWCGGRSTKRDVVNVSHQWGGQRSPWYRGERGLFHVDCSSIESASKSCVCDPQHGSRTYGSCPVCGKRKVQPTYLPAVRLLASVPSGQRDRNVWKQVQEIGRERRHGV